MGGNFAPKYALRPHKLVVAWYKLQAKPSR